MNAWGFNLIYRRLHDGVANRYTFVGARIVARDKVGMNVMRALIGAMVFVSLGGADASPLQPRSTERVVLLALDGLSSDGLAQAPTPSLDALRDGGAFVVESRGVMPSKSSPNWASILTGVSPSIHGIHSNQWWWFRWTRHLEYPTLFTALKRSRRAASRTAAVYEWDNFGRLWDPEDVDTMIWSPQSSETLKLIDRALVSMPHFMVVHLVGIDRAGHQYGWESPQYLRAITEVDQQVGAIVAMLREKAMFDDVLLVVVSDHGGRGKRHGGNSDIERNTPAIFYGPSIRRGYVHRVNVSNRDIYRTVHSVLRLPTLGILEGQPLPDLFID